MRMIPFFYSILLYAVVLNAPLLTINFTTYNVYNILVSSRLHQNAVERVDPCHKRTVTIGEILRLDFFLTSSGAEQGRGVVQRCSPFLDKYLKFKFIVSINSHYLDLQ